MISNIFEYPYNFNFISQRVLKNKIFEHNWKKSLSEEGVFDNGNGNWCILGRAFLCRTGHFCVEPCIFVSIRAFLCRTMYFLSNMAFLCWTSVKMLIRLLTSSFPFFSFSSWGRLPSLAGEVDCLSSAGEVGCHFWQDFFLHSDYIACLCEGCNGRVFVILFHLPSKRQWRVMRMILGMWTEEPGSCSGLKAGTWATHRNTGLARWPFKLW